MMFALICVALVVAAVAVRASIVLEEESRDDFQRFLNKYNKTYSTHEQYVARRQIFNQNSRLIREHNAKQLSWRMDINEFADMTYEEFRRGRFGYRADLKTPVYARRTVNLDGVVTVPDSVDWRTKNAVTPVKNQGQCGSCWSFSTTGSVEGAVALKTGKLLSLSEQQLVDCSGPEGDMGCNGGLMDNAFKYIIQNNGICSEKAYPYTASNGQCHSCTDVADIKSFVDVTPNNEAALKAAVALQPVSVAIEADQMGFQFYSSGVFTGTCGTNLDHGVLAVGYGTLNGQDYWIVKNSWGASWGMQGYILLARNFASPHGQCGIAIDPSYPVA